MTYEWKVRINDDFASLNKYVYIYLDKFDGTVDILKANGEIQNVSRGALTGPTMSISGEMLQALFDEMSRKGMKPPAASYIEGKLEAVAKHLEDMRTLVFRPSEITHEKEEK